MYHEALRDSHLSRNTRKLIFQQARIDCHLLKMENKPQGKAKVEGYKPLSRLYKDSFMYHEALRDSQLVEIGKCKSLTRFFLLRCKKLRKGTNSHFFRWRYAPIRTYCLG